MAFDTAGVEICVDDMVLCSLDNEEGVYRVTAIQGVRVEIEDRVGGKSGIHDKCLTVVGRYLDA